MLLLPCDQMKRHINPTADVSRSSPCCSMCDSRNTEAVSEATWKQFCAELRRIGPYDRFGQKKDDLVLNS